MPINASRLNSLKSFNSFNIDCICKQLIVATTLQELLDIDINTSEPMLILGGGSNVLFTENFDGNVVVIATKGICVSEDKTHFYLNVAAGENWHKLVEFSLANNIYGLENLALIPGTVGAAPIQNIGAYGVEFCEVCDWVEYLDLNSKELIKLSASKCSFGYRDSIFKSGLSKDIVITRVGLKLNKAWKPVLSYGPLQNFDTNTVTAFEIFNRVCEIRKQKLPDPMILGNAGSFFKNPIVSANTYMSLAKKFPNIVGYALTDGRVKLAAAWLIDNAGLKGFTMGNVGVHKEQALVLVNLGGASGHEVLQLAKHVIKTVMDKFEVTLEPEPKILGNKSLVIL